MSPFYILQLAQIGESGALPSQAPLFLSARACSKFCTVHFYCGHLICLQVYIPSLSIHCHIYGNHILSCALLSIVLSAQYSNLISIAQSVPSDRLVQGNAHTFCSPSFRFYMKVAPLAKCAPAKGANLNLFTSSFFVFSLLLF